MSLEILRKLIKEELEDFTNSQKQEIVTFEDNPLEYIIQKYPSLDATLDDLMTANYRDFITGIYVIAPKPTTFKVLLHNNQEFYLIYGPKAYTAKIAGKKYFLLNLNEEQFAITAIALLLELGMPPGSEGPGEEIDNDSLEPDEASKKEDEKAAEAEPEEEKLAEGAEAITPPVVKFKIIRESLEEGRKGFEGLSPEAQEVGKKLMQQLNIPQTDIETVNRKTIALLSPEIRSKFIPKLVKLGYTPSINKKGVVDPESGIEIVVKPKGGTEFKDISTNKRNERDFNSIINSKVEENGGPITVIFKSDKKNIINKNVASSKDASASDVRDFKKADSQLLDPNGKIVANISLKMLDAMRWESSTSRIIEGRNLYKTIMEKLLKGEFPNIELKPLEGFKNKFKMYDPETGNKLSTVIIENTPPELEKEVIFGTDVPQTIVLKENFENYSNYTFENGILTLNVSKIYTKLEDVIGTYDEPIFALSHHSGHPFGIEFRSFSKGIFYKDGELKKSATTIDYNDLK
jgi:hypothetical protein